jgi:3-oxoacyl-[acyl-carrier-protein] synthase III
MGAPDIHVRSIGTVLPGPPIGNAELTRRFRAPAVTEQWIDSFVGTRHRHFAVDLETGEIRYSVADLAATAGRRALAAAGFEPADVDLVVLGTASPDQLMPATVNVVADRLGIDRVPTYQLLSGCTGAVQALDVAYQMMRGGRHRLALVLGAESCAKHLDPTADLTGLTPAEHINGMLFGDGAGALLLSTEPGPDAAVVRHVHLQLAGLGRAPGQVVEWRGMADRPFAGPAIVEDYKAVEQSVPELAAEVLAELLNELGWKDSELDYVLPPQLSGRMTERIMARLGLPDASEVSRVADIGNTGNALPFFQLEAALPRMVAGDRLIGIAIESSKWIKAGFALEKI